MDSEGRNLYWEEMLAVQFSGERPGQPVLLTDGTVTSHWPSCPPSQPSDMLEERGGRCGGCYLEHARQRPDGLGLAFTSNLLVVTWTSHSEAITVSLHHHIEHCDFYK